MSHDIYDYWIAFSFIKGITVSSFIFVDPKMYILNRVQLNYLGVAVLSHEIIWSCNIRKVKITFIAEY